MVRRDRRGDSVRAAEVVSSSIDARRRRLRVVTVALSGSVSASDAAGRTRELRRTPAVDVDIAS
jgi:hypothetical protein